MEIINSEHNTSSFLRDEQPRIIRLTEISAKNFPTESGFYKYKCHLHLTSDSGQLLLQKELFTRQQPNWLLNLKSEEDCMIAITLFVREGDITQLWQDVGTVTFATDQVLNGQSNTEVELPLTTWSLAPHLKLQTRLTQNAHDSNNTLNLMPVRLNRQAGSHLKSHQATESVAGQIPEAVTLLPQEEVIVKDVWNKVRSFKELCMELFFERLLLEAPELTDVFGDAIDGMRDRFYELFDCCVRQLQPHTEYGVRESLVGVPPVRNDAYNTVEDYTALFADIGMRLPHWLIARKVWMWMLPSIPYLEEYDRENLSKGSDSAFYRFFNSNVILPMVEAIRYYEAVHNPEMLNRMWQSWQVFSQNKQLMGFEFYQILFEQYPQVLPLFGRANVDYLSLHLFQALDFLVQSLRNGDVFLPEVRELGLMHRGFGVPPSAYGAIADVMFSLFEKYVPDFTPELRHAWQTLFDRVVNVMKQPKLNEKQLLGKARQYLETIAKEQAWEQADYDRRWAEVEQEVKATGAYTHTYEELAYGAQLAWRNAPQCIGRIQWNNMIVRDRRHVTNPDEMFQEVLEHLRMGTNGGNLQIVMTVFRPKQPMERWGPRFWNPQYVRYAAYELEDGTIMGDGANLDLTKTIIQEMGWKPPEPRTPYDILPLVIEVPGMEPKLYEIPREEVLEVEIEHPTVAEFALKRSTPSAHDLFIALE